MKTEQELLSMLRSALDGHEKTPFDQVRGVVKSARTRQTNPNSSGFRINRGRQFALAAACLLIIAGVGLVFPSQIRGIVSPGNETALLEPDEATAESPTNYYTDGYEAAGAPDCALGDNLPETLDEAEDSIKSVSSEAGASGIGSISDSLLALMEQYADQPGHRFSVTVVEPAGEPDERSKNTGSDLRNLTADEIRTLSEEGFILDVAPDSSS